MHLQEKDLNWRQPRWIELLKDFDITILFYLEKVNVVVDALSRKSMGTLSFMILKRRPMARDF